MAEAIRARMQDAPQQGAGAEEAMSLPGWIYRDPDFFAVSGRRSPLLWQIV
ncbi:hypothetical protein [Azospirillum sp. B4]|uniref:hypothetical protein n=1 Tax=Azospirillum sp. B4 TaxID=95605 RepID=UPI000349AD5D|nr:hypothetical protein [Azospirillum sp. B4]